MPITTEPIPSGGFDPLIFWDKHKSQIILYAGIIVCALAAFAIYQAAASRKIATAEKSFANAKSAEDYQQVMQKSSGTSAAGNAYLLHAEALRKEKKYDQANSTLRDFIAKYPTHPLVSSGWMSIGANGEAAGKIDEALEAYQQVITAHATSFNAPAAAIARANLLRSKGDIEGAKRTYENLNAQFPKSYYAQQAMREMKLLRK